jgi:hypothetical protein
MLGFIHEFGFCEIQHIMQRFNMKRTSSYEQMKLLIRFGMVENKKVLPDFPSVYLLTTKAGRYIGSDLPIMPYVPIHHYTHYRDVLKVYLQLREKFPEYAWTTERRLLRQKLENSTNHKEHLPDGMLVLPDEKRIAIEVERSAKGKERLLTILTDYQMDNAIHEVWYFCLPPILTLLKETARRLSKIKIHLLDEEEP